MNITRKQILIEFLYPNSKLMTFMCNDVYQELLNIVSTQDCICCKNINKDIRDRNFRTVKKIIYKFIINNENYKNLLFEYYKSKDVDMIANNILLGLVFYISNTNDKYIEIDILMNKKSICYNKYSILYSI